MKKRKLNIQKLESRYMMHGDVNMDGNVTSADALYVINEIAKSDSNEIQVSSIYDSRDVNDDLRITALDALIVINMVGRMNDANPSIIKFKLGQQGTNGITDEQIHWAIQEAFAEYEYVANVDFQIVHSGENYIISSGELYLGNGVHARGWNYPTTGGKYIQYHSGYVGPYHRGCQCNPLPYQFNPIANPESLKRILMHEIGHALMHWGHSTDPSAVMNINATSDNFNNYELTALRNRFK